MTLEIALVYGILLAAVALFVTGWLRMDMTALLVLALLAISGILTPAQAFAGFSSPAVITVGGMFVISAALARTGVANILGRQLLRVAGSRERPLVVTIMLTAGVLSSVMNNIGVAAMLLPVVMDISRRTGHSPSRLLMPLVLGSLMGGLTTLVGTPPNLLASEALREHGLAPFRLLDFTGPGGLILVMGVAFVSFVGVRLLPSRDPRGAASGPTGSSLVETFNLQERLFTLRVPERSPLAGKLLAETRLGSALGLHVIAVLRGRDTTLAPSPHTRLQAGDRLVVQGRPDLLIELRDRRHLQVEPATSTEQLLVSADVGLAEAHVVPKSELEGSTLLQLGFRQRFGVIVLALLRDGAVRRTQLERIRLQAGDVLLLQGQKTRLEQLTGSRAFPMLRPADPREAMDRFLLDERFISLRVTESSLLAGRSLADTRIGDAAGLTVVAIIRDGHTSLVPEPDATFQAGDVLLIKAHPADLAVLRGLRRLEIEEGEALPLSILESDRVGLMEVALAPRSSLVGKAPREIGFRDKYGLSVLAVWRGDRAYRSNLRDMPLRFGDALLVFGPRDRLRLLAREPDFLALSEDIQEPPLTAKAPVSVAVLAAVLLPVLFGYVSIAVAVVVGAVAMVLSRCLTPEEAYRAVEWPAVILIAGMLPLGTALEQSGGARLVADAVLGSTQGLGPRGILAGLCIITALGAQLMPAAAVVVLMAPIAITTAGELGLSPHALLMGVALSAASLSSPVAHPANVLIMGPGGYRYVDYLRLGIPLTVMVLALVVAVVPLFFPLTR
ncbi:MAG TPA: SLC13 family permease [Longimicrobiales bacterium]|nr:SLC13 family permease [Longimicrobiales bacterium]